MLHDLVIVGAGPVGATAALALADSELDAVALDGRAPGAIARGDRSLALSHGSRLILERLGVWGQVAAEPGAVTPIEAIEISQRGGFGRARLEAEEHD
ncbi:MAG TPA: FAD-dependent monooxygenase, partial [Casimicrobiaceae bacterium]